MIGERIKRQMRYVLPKTISYFKKDKMHELKRRLFFDEYEVTAYYTGRPPDKRSVKVVSSAIQREYLFFEGEELIRFEADWIVFRPNGFYVTYRQSR